MAINDQQLDHLAALAAAATPGPWHLTDCSTIVAPLTADTIADVWEPTAASRNGEFIEAARDAVPELVAEVRRLRADAAVELLPDWEAVYEPGNVSDYLIGYANDEDPAKAAAEAWLRSQKDDIGRLEWVPEERLATGRYDRWFELIEHHDDGIPTGPGLIVRRRAVEETHVVADDSDDSEAGTRLCGYGDYHDGHEWVSRPDVWCPGISYAANQPAARSAAV